MSRVASRGPLGLKEPRGERDEKRMGKVAALPCCICCSFGLPQNSPTQVHHCIHERHGTRRAPDSLTIPLCEGHHQGDMDTSKIAIHRGKREWMDRYGKDTDWLKWTDERIDG